MKFLDSICILCRTAKHQGLSQGLDVFCHSYELAENIKVRGHPAPLGKGARPPGTGTLGGQRLGGVRLWWHWVLAAARSHPACALQVLLEEEPRDQLCTALRQQAMLAIAELRYLPIPPGDPSPRGPCPPARGLEAPLPAPPSDGPLSLLAAQWRRCWRAKRKAS